MTAYAEETTTLNTVTLDDDMPVEGNPSQLFLGLNLERADEAIMKVGKEEYLVDAFGDFETKDADGYMPTMDSDRLRIGLPQFEGPLDLLLFLIRRHAMNIFDIPIVTITEKYLEVIDRMKQTNLEVSSINTYILQAFFPPFFGIEGYESGRFLVEFFTDFGLEFCKNP